MIVGQSNKAITNNPTNAYSAVREQIGKCLLRGQDRIFQLKLGEIMRDGNGIPVSLALVTDAIREGGGECLGLEMEFSVV